MDIVEYSPPIHGKTSKVFHDNTGVFIGLPNPFDATRYHSLVIDTGSIPDSFTMNAWTDDGYCMGILSNKEGALLQGVQFHPESFLTTDGPQLLSAFLQQGC
jgi:anthranilate synthase component 2